MRVVFVGSQNIGYGCLMTLLEHGHEVVRVYTNKPDQHEIAWYASVEELALSEGLKVEVDPDLRSERLLREIEQLAPDLICVMGWRRIIPDEVLAVPDRGTVAIHFSPLPKGRGFAPVNWSIINGWRETGATLFYLDEGVDTGDVIGQVSVSIDLADTARDLSDKLTAASLDMFAEFLPVIADGTGPRTPQDHSEATYFAKRIPGDGLLDWAQPTMQLYNKVRALTDPYPGAFTHHKEQRLYVWKATLPPEPQTWYGTPGQIVRITPGKSAWVLSGDGILQLESVQLDGDEKRHAGDYFKSLNTRLG